MNPFELELTLDAAGPTPVALAWQRYDDLDLWPTSSPLLRSVITDRAGETRRLATGLTGEVHGPLGVRAGFEVLSLDAAAMRWSWRVRRGPLVVQLEHRVESAPDGTGSRTWLTLRGPTPLILGYAPVAWLALHRLVSLPV